MKPLVERILEFLEDKARRLFDPESSQAIPSRVPVKPQSKASDKPNEKIFW